MAAAIALAGSVTMAPDARATVTCYGCWTTSSGNEKCGDVVVGGYQCTVGAFCAAVGGCGSANNGRSGMRSLAVAPSTPKPKAFQSLSSASKTKRLKTLQ